MHRGVLRYPLRGCKLCRFFSPVLFSARIPLFAFLLPRYLHLTFSQRIPRTSFYFSTRLFSFFFPHFYLFLPLAAPGASRFLPHRLSFSRFASISRFPKRYTKPRTTFHPPFAFYRLRALCASFFSSAPHRSLYIHAQSVANNATV